jgi:hypothetical protein
MRVTDVHIRQRYEFASDGIRPSVCEITFTAQHDSPIAPDDLRPGQRRTVALPAIGDVVAVCTSVSSGWHGWESEWTTVVSPTRSPQPDTLAGTEVTDVQAQPLPRLTVVDFPSPS